MSSHDAPEAWRAGKYDEVAEYCLKDAQLVYDLYKYSVDEGIVKSRSLEDGKIVEIDIEW